MMLCVDLAFCLCMYVRSAWIGSVTAALIHILGTTKTKGDAHSTPIPLSFPTAFGSLVGWLVICLVGCFWFAGWLAGYLFGWLVHTPSFVCLSLFFLVLHRYRRSPRTLVGTVGSGCSKNCLSLPFPLWPYRCYRSGSFDFV